MCLYLLIGERGGVFAGHAVYITSGVFDDKAPSEILFRAIIESGGGQFIEGSNGLNDYFTSAPSSSSSSSSSKKVKNENTEKLKLIIISNIKTLNKKDVSTDVRASVAKALKMRLLGGKGVYTSELLFLAVLRQELKFSEEHILDF